MAVTGTRVLGGRYVLGEMLGAGGMATVWRARDEVLGREVAVKVLSPQYAADAGFLARFEREARHVAALSHPRLVTVFDCGIDGGTAFIVMELVAGRTLRQVLDDGGALPPAEATAIAVAVCEGLEVAHAAGLVHRDIKPANIVLSRGEVKVLDFGIARADGTAAHTRTQGILGTAAYLPPELASGGQAGPQADLYSLGCVLFEMLTGDPPFMADSAVGLAYRHVHDDPGPPSARRPGLPPRLDLIVGRLLAKDPAARPPGAAAARAGLLTALPSDATAVLPVPAGGPGPARHGRGGRRRASRTEAVLAGALAAALAALAAVLITLWRATPAAPPSPAVTHQGSTTQAHSAPPAPSATGSPSVLPSTAAAAAAFVGDLEAGVAAGQVSQQAGQDLFDQLRQLLFGSQDQEDQQQDHQQVQQNYSQLVQVYDQDQGRGQITGPAANTLRQALQTLGNAVGAL